MCVYIYLYSWVPLTRSHFWTTTTRGANFMIYHSLEGPTRAFLTEDWAQLWKRKTVNFSHSSVFYDLTNGWVEGIIFQRWVKTSVAIHNLLYRVTLTPSLWGNRIHPLLLLMYTPNLQSCSQGSRSLIWPKSMPIHCRILQKEVAFLSGQALQMAHVCIATDIGLEVLFCLTDRFYAVPDDLLEFPICIFYIQKRKLLDGKFSKAAHKFSFMDAKFVLTNIYVMFICNCCLLASYT